MRVSSSDMRLSLDSGRLHATRSPYASSPGLSLRESYNRGTICQPPSLQHRFEPEEAMMHGFRPWRAVSAGSPAGPSTEPCDDPGEPGEGCFIVRVPEFFRTPFAFGVDGTQAGMSAGSTASVTGWPVLPSRAMTSCIARTAAIRPTMASLVKHAAVSI